MERPASEARVCGRCGYETLEEVKICPRCGARALKARTMRVLGWVLLLIGSALTIFVGTIAFYVARIVYGPHEPGVHAEFTGSPVTASYIFAVFGFVIVFGLACAAGGAWQVLYARPNRKLMFVIIALGVFFLIAGRLVRLFQH